MVSLERGVLLNLSVQHIYCVEELNVLNLLNLHIKHNIVN